MASKENKKIKFEIDNGFAFFADEAGIMQNPLRIIFDFRSVTPRLDIRNQEFQPLVIKHNVVMMDPFAAKALLDMLKKNIRNYEKEFGKITKPSALKKIERQSKKDSKVKTKAPIYFG